MAKIYSSNPAKNYQIIGNIDLTTSQEITRKVKLANTAKEKWHSLGFSKRIVYLKKAYALLFKAQTEIAQLITKEIGTPITECLDEVAWNFSYFDWFLQNVQVALKPQILSLDGQTRHEISYEPTGSVAAITPWNLPFDMFIWAVIPNLLVGNTVIYKAAEECVLTGKLLEKILKKVGLPEGVLNFIHGGPKQGQQLVNEDIDLIWFTGSSEVGKKLYQLAGRKFIKCVLEMGGSNPGIVLPDADLNLVVEHTLAKRYSFCGQTCDALKRLIVHKHVYTQLVEKLQNKVSTLIVGDPEDPATQIGPLSSRKQLQILKRQVQDAVNKGAKIIMGGKQAQNLKGAYYLPTILTNISRNMKVWQEEVFGPVLPVVKFSTEAEAINLANETPYGLGALIFTRDANKAKNLAEQIKSGNVTVNGAGHFKPYLPFGGYKNSGMGREHGIEGFRELCQMKTISTPIIK